MPDYIDILPLLTKASSSLGHNELIQSPYISLFETNSAVEIGEPRMDTGVLTAAERALPPFEVHRALLPEEIIWLMDTILGYETLWHEGSSLLQTLHNCMYFHELDSLLDTHAIRAWAKINGLSPDYPPQLVSVVLRACLRGCLKTVDLAMEEVLKGNLYDNEDIVSEKAGVSLLEHEEIDTILDELYAAQDWLLDWEGDLAAEWKEPLLLRIRLRTEILCAVTLFAIETPIYEHVPGHLANARLLLDAIVSQRTATVTIPGVINPYLARRLEAMAPPRPPLPAIPLAKAVDAVKELLNGMQGAVELQCLEDWLAIEARFRTTSRSAAPVFPYVRSLHQSVFYSKGLVNGRHPLQWLGQSFFEQLIGYPIDDLRSAVEPSDGPAPLAGASLRARLDRVVQTASGYLVTYVGHLGKNKPKQYRKMAGALDQWQTVHDTALRWTKDLERQSVSQSLLHDPTKVVSAIALIRNEITLRVLQLGFELELFAQNELTTIYWYMAKVAEQATEVCAHLLNGREDVPVRLLQKHNDSEIATAIATTSFQLLSLENSPVSDATMDKALFNRRFKWALQEGTLKPAWSDYQKDAEETQHMGGSALLAACRDRLERATGHLGLARMYSPEVDTQLAACRQNLEVISSTEDPTLLRISSQWTCILYPSFEQSSVG